MRRYNKQRRLVADLVEAAQKVVDAHWCAINQKPGYDAFDVPFLALEDALAPFDKGTPPIAEGRKCHAVSETRGR